MQVVAVVTVIGANCVVVVVFADGEHFVVGGEHFVAVGEHFVVVGEHFVAVGEHFVVVGEHFVAVEPAVVVVAVSAGVSVVVFVPGSFVDEPVVDDWVVELVYLCLQYETTIKIFHKTVLSSSGDSP